MDPGTLIREYLLLGLRFDRIEEGYVDSFTGDPSLREAVAAEPSPDPADLARQADRLCAELPNVPRVNGFDQSRADYLGAHLRALACAGRKFAGEDVGFVDEVEAYFDVHIEKGDPERYLQAHRMLDEALGGSGPLADRVQAYRAGEEIPPDRLEEAIGAFSSALRDRVRAEFPLPDSETINLRGGHRQAVVGVQLLPGRLSLDRRGQCRPQAADVQPARARRARVIPRPPHRALPQGGRTR